MQQHTIQISMWAWYPESAKIHQKVSGGFWRIQDMSNIYTGGFWWIQDTSILCVTKLVDFGGFRILSSKNTQGVRVKNYEIQYYLWLHLQLVALPAFNNYVNPPIDCKGQKSLKMLIYLPRYRVHLSRTLSNLTCSKYIYRLKLVDHFWLVKALSCIVKGGQNDSKNQSKKPASAHLGQQSKTDSWLILTSIATCH